MVMNMVKVIVLFFIFALVSELVYLLLVVFSLIPSSVNFYENERIAYGFDLVLMLMLGLVLVLVEMLVLIMTLRPGLNKFIFSSR